MSPLTAAHQGYEYQDILTATRAVDLMLEGVAKVDVDKKLFDGDLFDDITLHFHDGSRERIQVKYSSLEDAPLSDRVFVSDARNLRFDSVLTSALADRELADADKTRFRIIFRSQTPASGEFFSVLDQAPDSAPFLDGFHSNRYRISAERLFELSVDSELGSLISANGFSREDVSWVCGSLLLEFGAPVSSANLLDPGPLEDLLLSRVRSDLGAELPPNEGRSAVDVATALIAGARLARQARVQLDVPYLLKATQLRDDFGAVTKSEPIDPSIEIERRRPTQALIHAATQASEGGQPLIISGPPGQGKSWLAQQLQAGLDAEGWLTAEHYCYLNREDGERLDRVITERLFGSLVGRLVERDPGLTTDQRPRFAADAPALTSLLRRARQDDPSRPIALIVDGIDHAARVATSQVHGVDASTQLCSELSALELPAGCALIVLGQPGHHLSPLDDASPLTVEIPALTREELSELADNLGALSSTDLISTPAREDDFVDLLVEKSQGNALYATYICREASESGITVDQLASLEALPVYDGSLGEYYEFLTNSLEENSTVADLLALAEIGLRASELREIAPSISYQVDRSLERLRPVLTNRYGSGGFQIYHESFSRFIRERFESTPESLNALATLLTEWMTRLGFLADDRAFRRLLPLLQTAERDDQVVELIGIDFVSQAVSAGFPSSAIRSNLALAVDSAGRLNRWDCIAMCVELSRASDACESERFDTILVEFADVLAESIGAEAIGSRLLREGMTVMPARAGILMCGAVDALGGSVPWEEYMAAFEREKSNDNTHYGADSDRAVKLAWLRGRLRMSRVEGLESEPPVGTSDDAEEDPGWDPIASWIETSELDSSEAVKAVIQTRGFEAASLLIASADHPGPLALSLAEQLPADPAYSEHSKNLLEFAIANPPSGGIHRILRFGVDPTAFSDALRSRDELLSGTRDVLLPRVEWEAGAVSDWLDRCALAARTDELGLNAVEALLDGAGWYRCWLRFAVGLCRAEASAEDQSRTAMGALRQLTGDLEPFVGSPRACDLFQIHGAIAETLERAFKLVSDEDWAEALSVLVTVSDGITTTMSGELGGPVPIDHVMRLAVRYSNTSRKSATENLIADQIANGGADRFYEDLATYRLLSARLAIESEDPENARNAWHQACIFLTGYGWRKDATLFELLDPFEELVQLDLGRARRCVAKSQALSERVPLHTDGKGTRHAWTAWMRTLAMTDPVELAIQAQAHLLARSNDPDELWVEGIEMMWSEWHDRASPTIAAALRIALPAPIKRGDPIVLERLLREPSDPSMAKTLATAVIARGDERHVRYAYSNSDDLISEDSARICELNQVAQSHQLSEILPPPIGPPPDPNRQPSNSRARRASRKSVVEPLDARDGKMGILDAARKFRERPYEWTGSEWSSDRFMNAIGFRLLELSDGDAIQALHQLPAEFGFADAVEIFRGIAEGLDRCGRRKPAAHAYALAWVHARGRGGWLLFGGATEIESLKRASEIDAEVSRLVVIQNIAAHVAAGRYGTMGITQALIVAFARKGLIHPAESETEVTFSIWDRAFEAIEFRAPRVDESDDPDWNYEGVVPASNVVSSAELDSAFLFALLALLAHPSRESKRRTLLASTLSLSESAIDSSLSHALTSISDAATVSWVLAALLPVRDQIGTATANALRELLSEPCLVVRTLARQNLEDAQAPLPAGEVELGLWDLPEPSPPIGIEEMRKATGLVQSKAADRLIEAEQIVPGLTRTVSRRTASLLDEPAMQRRLERQLDQLANRSLQRWPDAVVVTEEAVEASLQQVSANARATAVRTGNYVGDPVQWEAALAEILLDSPTAPIAFERRRIPRPKIATPDGPDSPIWINVTSDPQEFDYAETYGDQARYSTVASSNDLEAITVGEFEGWVWVATIEDSSVAGPWRREGELDFETHSYSALEVQKSGNLEGLSSPPFAEGDVLAWESDCVEFRESAFDASQPLFSLTPNLGTSNLHPSQMGIAPTAVLAAALSLSPHEPYVMTDPAGPAIFMANWRAAYDRSDYHLAFPRSVGVGVAMRPDCFAKLRKLVGEDLVTRQFAWSNYPAFAGVPR